MLMFALSQILLLWIGGRQIVRGELTLGQFVQIQQNMVFLQWPMLALGWTTNLVQRGLASWKRIRLILDSTPDIRDGDQTDRSLAEARGDIEFLHVSLRRGERTLLRDLNLVIPEGQCLALTGPTGSGKTLLVSLIVRLLDASEGSVVLGGRDVRAYPLDVLRRGIGVAPQEPFLFSDTLANNLAFGLAEADAAEVIRAAEIARLRPDVDGFPQRFETLLGERGVTLSGGQRQRTAIGRALARRPRILILDDVFSAVDTQTEAAILDRLRPELRGRTSILISHRVSTLRTADRIIVLEAGRILQDGTHAELVQQPGYYRELDEVQRLAARLEETEARAPQITNH
jgi:ATP-binding cassette, subfamily B, multidrug efflux pump